MKIILKILKFMAILLAVILVIGGAIWMVYIRKWPLWTGASLIVAAIGLIIAWHFIKRILVRRNERAFVKQVVEQEQPVVDVTGNRTAEQLHSLERQWSEAINLLKGSYLAKQGDPLYVLPWYMIMGASGSGKSSALRSARLSSPFPEAMQPAGIGTRYCDWWFTEHAIFLDTAGKYANPALEASDHDEWQRLLSLLMASRKREPLNGLVVSVESSHLLENNGDLLEEEGRVIRLRVDELMRVLGARFPVYIMVTKCDQVYGMVQAVEQLPDSFLRQPMGVINDDFDRPTNDFLELAFTSISERLKDLRLLQLDKISGNKTGLMLLPEEFCKMKPGLERFMGGLFRLNPYQESLLMRGLYFCSALQTGSPVSRFIENLAVSGHSVPDISTPALSGMDSDRGMRSHDTHDGVLFMDVLPGTRRGMFLFDFFDWVMPTDRWLFKPHRQAVRRMRITWSLGAVAWLAVMAGILGMISTSYILNRTTINIFSNEFAEPVRLKYDLENDLVLLDRMWQTIVRMEQSHKRWRFITLGFNQSAETIATLKKRYCELCNEFLEKETNKKIVDRVLKFNADTPGIERGAYILAILDRLQYLNARIDGKGLEYLKKLPTPSGTFLILLDGRLNPEMAARYQSILLYFSAWEDDMTSADVQRQRWTMLLSRALTGRSGEYDFTWLQDWINTTSSADKITIDSFWLSSGSVAGTAIIEPCFTLKGKQVIDTFLERVKKMADNASMVDKGIKQFKEDYAQRYMSAWEQFADEFPAGIYSFSSIHEMHSQATEISNGKLPADRFIQRLVTEMKPFADDPNIPDLLRLAIQYDRALEQSSKESLLKQASGLSKTIGDLADKGKNLLDEAKKKESHLTDKTDGLAKIEQFKSFAAYKKAIQDMAKGVNSGPAATRLAQEIFSQNMGSPAPPPADPGGGAAAAVPAKPFTAAQDSIKVYQAQMRPVGDDPVFWEIVDSTLNFFALMSTREASCSLQSQWQSQVLAESAAATEANLNDFLLGAQGVVWKFVKGPAAPFIKATAQGYKPATVMGQRISFNQEFFDFLNRGQTGRQMLHDSYSMKITARPVDVNRETVPKPHSVALVLSCGDTLQSINNMNFPVAKTFKWTPKTCGDTTLKIKIGDIQLEKVYSGQRGFIKFLEEFRHGEREFMPTDFPEHQQKLQDMRLRRLRLIYNFSGHQSLLSLPQYAPLNAPPVIATCWKRE